MTGGPLVTGVVASVLDVVARRQNPFSYSIFFDGINYHADSMFGRSDFSGPDCATVLQAMFDDIALIIPGIQAISGTPADNTQFLIIFSAGNFYFSKKVRINLLNAPSGGVGISVRGQGDNRTTLILQNGVNDDMFSITGMGNIIQFSEMKLAGNSGNQSGTSNGIKITEAQTGEVNCYNIEFTGWKTACIDIGASVVAQWNYFTNCWFLNATYGIRCSGSQSDMQIIGCKFENCVTGGIAVEAGNGNTWIIVANRFGFSASSNVYFSTGTTSNIVFVGNIVRQFTGTGVAGFQISGNGLVALADFKAIIADNVFTTTVAGAIGVYLGDYVDGVRISSNRFTGYTDPFNFINTHQKATTFVDANTGLPAKYTGWGVTTPVVPSSGSDQQNTNPFPVKVFISGVGSGISAYGITDGNGTLNSFTTTIAVGAIFEIPPYGKIRLTYTGSPTWLWFGTGNGGGV